MILNTFMAAFLLHNFNAGKWWWVGLIIICLLDTFHEINNLDRVK